MECEFPTVNAHDDEIKAILEESKIIVIYGLSPDETKDSFKVAKYLQDHGYRVIPIYPKEETILGEKVYRNLAEIPFDVDIVDIFRKGAFVMNVVDEALARGGVKTIWAQLGIVNNEAGEKALANGLKFVQNKCTKIEHKVHF